MKRRTKKAEFYAKQIEEQRRWIEEHGGNLAGYVARYGFPGQPGCFGNGGWAIYSADMNALREMETQLARHS